MLVVSFLCLDQLTKTCFQLLPQGLQQLTSVAPQSLYCTVYSAAWDVLKLTLVNLRSANTRIPAAYKPGPVSLLVSSSNKTRKLTTVVVAAFANLASSQSCAVVKWALLTD